MPPIVDPYTPPTGQYIPPPTYQPPPPTPASPGYQGGVGPLGLPNKPLWAMTPIELQRLALSQARTFYQPTLAEYRRQQQQQAMEAQAQREGLAKLILALQGASGEAGNQVAQAFTQAGQGGQYADQGDIWRKMVANQGEIQYLTAIQDQNKTAGELRAQIAQVQGQIPQTAMQLYGQYGSQLSAHETAQRQQQAQDLQIRKYLSSEAKRYSDSTGILMTVNAKGTGITPVLDARGKPISTANQSYSFQHLADGTIQPVDKTTGQPVGAPIGPKKATTPTAPPSLQSKTIGGKVYNFNPKTGVYTDPATGAVATPTAGTMKSGAKIPTANQINAMVQGWYTGKPVRTQVQALDKNKQPVYVKSGARKGAPVMITKTTSSGTLSYQQAYKKLRAFNIDDVTARQVLDTTYARGERGRPWVSAPMRAVLRTSKLKPNASYLTKQQANDALKLLPTGAGSKYGFAYLTMDQARVLQAAGQLPPGTAIRSTGGYPGWIGRLGGAIYLIEA